MDMEEKSNQDHPDQEDSQSSGDPLDIESMLQMSFGEEPENSEVAVAGGQEEDEVMIIEPIGEENNSTVEEAKETTTHANTDDPADDPADDPPDIEKMLEMNFEEDSENSKVVEVVADQGEEVMEVEDVEETATGPANEVAEDSKDTTMTDVKDVEEQDSNCSPRRPRRAAAAAAANSIKEMSSKENEWNIVAIRNHRSRKDNDSPYNEQNNEMRRCSTCKKWGSCDIKVQQYGTNVFFCSNTCMTKQKNMSATGRMACYKCGRSNLHLDTDTTLYWETMNFCSELCVGNYQVDVGGKCSNCTNKVPWLSLGKYCVRFGSDIKQFCTAPCLETFKKNARVCFHCQLDIKCLGNVILANIPAKQAPKEFCSQNCVEMYVEQNLNQTAKSKSAQTYICVICAEEKLLYKELVVPPGKTSTTPMNLKTCSEDCWKRLIEAHKITNPIKCYTCSNFINLDLGFSHCLSTDEKVFGFCSATCKNVYVLKHRQILACVTCKVKKYNYDLIQVYKGHQLTFATCSLNCLPYTQAHIQNLRGLIAQASGGMLDSGGSFEDMENFPVINSVSSVAQPNAPLKIYMDSSGNLFKLQGVDKKSEIELSKLLQVDRNGELVVEETETQTTQQLNGKNWDGILTYQDIQDIINELDGVDKEVEMKTKYTMAKPRCSVAATQTDDSELQNMDRVPLKIQEITKYVPVPLPFPIYIPVPVYAMETPTPFPVPIPLPLLVPFIFKSQNAGEAVPSGDNTAENINHSENPPENPPDKDDNDEGATEEQALDSSYFQEH